MDNSNKGFGCSEFKHIAEAVIAHSAIISESIAEELSTLLSEDKVSEASEKAKRITDVLVSCFSGKKYNKAKFMSIFIAYETLRSENKLQNIFAKIHARHKKKLKNYLIELFKKEGLGVRKRTEEMKKAEIFEKWFYGNDYKNAIGYISYLLNGGDMKAFLFGLEESIENKEILFSDTYKEHRKGQREKEPKYKKIFDECDSLLEKGEVEVLPNGAVSFFGKYHIASYEQEKKFIDHHFATMNNGPGIGTHEHYAFFDGNKRNSNGVQYSGYFEKFFNTEGGNIEYNGLHLLSIDEIRKNYLNALPGKTEEEKFKALQYLAPQTFGMKYVKGDSGNVAILGLGGYDLNITKMFDIKFPYGMMLGRAAA